MSQAGGSRSEQRSVRRAERRRNAGWLFLGVGPAAAVILVIAVLFPLLASPGQRGEEAGEPRGVAVHSALLAARGNAWTGQAVTGTLVETGDATYLERDIRTARSALAGTGVGG